MKEQAKRELDTYVEEREGSRFATDAKRMQGWECTRVTIGSVVVITLGRHFIGIN